MITIYQVVFRLLLTVILAGLIGLERESRHRPAGLRTNILVGIGSCLIMLSSIYLSEVDGGDAFRLASGIMTGVGFLGAGVVIRGNGDKESVQGITTAATIYIVAIIGLTVGLGFYLAAIFAAILTLGILLAFESEQKKFGKK